MHDNDKRADVASIIFWIVVLTAVLAVVLTLVLS
jgi:hypothetical protein